MTPTSRLYDALNDFLRQCDLVWQDARKEANAVLDDDWHDSKPKCASQWIWRMRRQSCSTCPVSSETISTVVVESTN